MLALGIRSRHRPFQRLPDHLLHRPKTANSSSFASTRRRDPSSYLNHRVVFFTSSKATLANPPRPSLHAPNLYNLPNNRLPLLPYSSHLHHSSGPFTPHIPFGPYSSVRAISALARSPQHDELPPRLVRQHIR